MHTHTFFNTHAGEYMDVTSPLDGAVVGKVAVSNASDVDAAVARAKASSTCMYSIFL